MSANYQMGFNSGFKGLIYMEYVQALLVSPNKASSIDTSSSYSSSYPVYV